MTEPEDPTVINWPERQARALIKFEIEGGRPICPNSWTVFENLRGRNGLPLWGENPHAAALVTCTYAGRRWVLLVQRPDDGTWAMPSGPIENGAGGSAIGYCAIQTGYRPYCWTSMDEPRWVPDPRGSMEAWVVLVVTRFDLGEVDSLPEVQGEWIRAGRLNLRAGVFSTHREILTQVK